MKKIVIFLSILLLSAQSVTAQSTKEKKKAQALAQFEELKALIESKKFDFEADWVTTARGTRINMMTNFNFLKFNNDSVNIYLPYFGSSTSGGASLAADSGIVFDGIPNKLKMDVNDKKKKISISFEASDKVDTFNITMSISGGGNTFITVNSYHRSRVNYEGKVTKPKPDKT